MINSQQARDCCQDVFRGWIGRSVGEPPSRSVAPTTCPCGIPVPAYLPVSVYPQCKRPPPSLLLTNGVHPCSLRTKTNVSSKAISWFQVLHQGRKDLVKREAEAGRLSWEVVRMHIPSGLHRSMFIPKQKDPPHTCRHKSSTGQGSLSEQGISVFFP